MRDNETGVVPSFETISYTPDQLAMIELLGNPTVVERRSVVLYYSEGTLHPGVSSIAGAHTMKHPCPVVEIAGRRRSIMPNGDLSSVD